jgi:hypothetical protein
VVFDILNIFDWENRLSLVLVIGGRFGVQSLLDFVHPVHNVLVGQVVSRGVTDPWRVVKDFFFGSWRLSGLWVK